jgi:hypothetical protein
MINLLIELKYFIKSLFCKHDYYWFANMNYNNIFQYEIHQCNKCYKSKKVYKKTFSYQNLNNSSLK